MTDYAHIQEWMEKTRFWLMEEKSPGSPAEAEILRDVLRFHEYQYYHLDRALITDPEYDRLYKMLEAWEKANPGSVTPDSPTQRVGKSLNTQFATVTHLVPMLSLDNSYNASDLYDWDRKAKELAGNSMIEYCIEPKYDGASISIIYENDVLVRSATRGDGVQGDDITVNSRQIRNLPLRAPFSRYGIQSIEIRGEVVMTKKAFEGFNLQLMENGQPPLANPRNAAAGTLRMKDPAEVGRRKLEAFLYHVSYVSQISNTQIPNSNSQIPNSKNILKEDSTEAPLEFGVSNFGISKIPTTHSGMLQMLWDCGFRSPVHEMKVSAGIEGVIDHCNLYEAKRDDLPYEIDGMVVKVNNLDQQDQLGMTTHHPRWAIAYKFKARQGTSRLRGVEFQVGRTGAVTPVAKIDPVGIGGVTVGSISIHNEDYIKEKDLKLGDTVVVERAGDVIPQIVRSVAELRTGTEKEIVFPQTCPVCQSALYKEADEAVWRCINVECEAQVVERIIHFVSKDALDIRSFGEQQVRRFYELGLLKDIPGIYKLDFDRISTLEGFGKKSVENLRLAIEQSKTQPLHRIIYGLGIRHVGETTAKMLAQRITHLLDLKALTVDQLMQLEDIGPKVASSIYGFFQNIKNIQMLAELENLGLTLRRAEQTTVEGGKLEGQTFLFTGTLSKLKRSDAEAMAEKAGGKILSGVSSKLNYLIVGEDAGSKLEKAKKIPTIRILTEEEYLNLLAYDN
ncbi:MAG: NAD-dependent DNA ligase LigA [Chitinophagaceae bacterium]|nr:NAD-dependent DNA ligase LigA [Chitinophagaceae bacterium]